MKRAIFFFLLVPFLFSNKQPPLTPVKLEPQKGKIFQTTGNLNQGQKLNDLSWAWNSSVACFPATQSQKFTGKHVLYEFVLPAYSEVEIRLIPADRKANFSLYAYEIGVNSEAVVPNLPSCIRCEADYKWDRPWRGKVQDHTRLVKNILAINRPYKVIIGVAGAEGLAEGEYRLEIKFVK